MALLAKLVDLARRHPWAALGLIAALTLLFGYGLAHLRIANDPQEFLPNQPEVQSYRQIERDFGAVSLTRKIFVRFAPRSGFAIDSPESMLEQEHVLEALRAVPGIASATGVPDWVKELRREMHGGDPNYATLPLEGDSLGYSFADIIRLTFQRLSLVKQYVSNDGTAIVVAQIDLQADLATVARAASLALTPLQEEAKATDISLMSYGTALGIFNRTTQYDLRLFAPLTIGLVTLWLIWLFGYRRWTNLYLVFSVVGLAGVWKLGLLGLLGLPLNFLLVSTIPLIIGVGIDYPIHLLHRYEEERQRTEGTGAMNVAVRTSSRMLLANTLTTVAGFSSLLLTQSLPIQTFGLLFSFAMVANFLLTFTLVPAIKQLQGEGSSLQRASRAGAISRIFNAYVRLVSAKRHLAAGVLLLIVLIGLGLFWTGRSLNLHASDLRRMLPSNYPVVRLYDQIDHEFYPYDEAELLVHGDAGRLALMRAQLTEIPMRLAGSPYTRQVQGIAQLIDDVRNANPKMEQGFMRQFQSVGPDSAYRWALDYILARPELAARAAAYVHPSEQGGYDETVVRIDTARYTAESDLRRVTADIRARLAPVINELEQSGYRVELTGTPFVELASLSAVRESFLTSRAFALVLSFLLVAWVLRSFLWGLIVVLLILPITGVELAAIRALGIEINAFTAVVGAVSIGLGVTYVIPLIERFREGRDLQQSLTLTGRATTAAYLSTMAAFLALLLSGIVWNSDFGILAGVAISAAYLVTILAFPALVSLVDHWHLSPSARQHEQISRYTIKGGIDHESDHLGHPAGAAAPGLISPGSGHGQR
jgi:predicted RND superfamily exporter protein